MGPALVFVRSSGVICPPPPHPANDTTTTTPAIQATASRPTFRCFMEFTLAFLRLLRAESSGKALASGVHQAGDMVGIGRQHAVGRVRSPTVVRRAWFDRCRPQPLGVPIEEDVV